MEDINWIKHLYLWCKMKGYSMENTFPVYRDTLNKILRTFPKLEATPLVEIQEYLSEIKNDNTRKTHCVLIRWAFDTVLHKPIDWRSLPYPRQSITIQPIYSQEEIMKVFNSVKHKKQKAILGLIIDRGTRIGEPLKIKITDCDSKKGQITLRQAKGKRDRFLFPSPFVWKLIKDYWNELKIKPTVYLFEGEQKGFPYTQTSIRKFVIRHCKITGVEYKGIHAIRRLAGSWWVENGVPETVAADTLGNSVKTLHKHYLIHSPTYMQNVPSILNPSPCLK